MTIVKVCRDARIPFENRTAKKDLKYYNAQNKFCCKYCDKKIVHKDRLREHEGKCQITCFNFLHKLESGKLQGKIFKETLPVHFKGNKLPMNEIEVNPINTSINLNNNELKLVELLDIEPIMPPIELLEVIVKEEINDCDNNISPLIKPTKPKKKVISCVIKDADIVIKPVVEPTLNDIIESDMRIQNEILMNEKITNCNEDYDTLTKCNTIYNSPNISEKNDIMANNNVKLNNLDYDKLDEDMNNIINTDIDNILDLINENRTDELLYYKSSFRSKYNDIFYLQIIPQLDNEYMVDIVTDYEDIDFITWKQNQYNMSV